MPAFDQTGPASRSFGPRDGRGGGQGFYADGPGAGRMTGGRRGLAQGRSGSALRGFGIGSTTSTEDKAQWIRLADVFAIGPLMVYGGYRLSSSEKILGWLLAALGVGTVVYNGKNYLEKR